ncbi:MAG: hypothetical protein WDA22_10835 [Bacteroidota bacterium]
MNTISGILRSNLLDKDFELLLQSRMLSDIIDDGFATNIDLKHGLFGQKKILLSTRLNDFVESILILDGLDLKFRKGINRHWGTTERMLKVVEKLSGRAISHGALLLALDLRGMAFESIEGRKDAFMSISDRTKT